MGVGRERRIYFKRLILYQAQIRFCSTRLYTLVTTWIQIFQYATDSWLSERSFPASLCTRFLIPQTERNTAQVPVVKPSLQPATWWVCKARCVTMGRGELKGSFRPSSMWCCTSGFPNPSTSILSFSSFPTWTTVLLYQLHPDFLSLFNPDFFTECLSNSRLPASLWFWVSRVIKHTLHPISPTECGYKTWAGWTGQLYEGSEKQTVAGWGGKMTRIWSPAKEGVILPPPNSRTPAWTAYNPVPRQRPQQSSRSWVLVWGAGKGLSNSQMQWAQTQSFSSPALLSSCCSHVPVPSNPPAAEGSTGA